MGIHTREFRSYWQEAGQSPVHLRGTTDLRDGEWHHVAFVRDLDGGEFRGYVDGNLEFSSSTAGTDLTFTATHLIGSDNRTGGLPFQGSIDEVAIHEEALTEAQVRQRAQLFDQRGNPFARVVDGRIDIGAIEASATSIGPDFDDDGSIDGTDIDLLQANIVTGPADPATFDLTGDGLVTIADRDEWLVQAGAANLTSGNPYLLGDASLDGVVDVSDFNNWNSNKFSATSNWTDGDFNADGVVDVSDFNSWNSNKFTASDAVAAQPSSGRADRFESAQVSNDGLADCWFAEESVESEFKLTALPPVNFIRSPSHNESRINKLQEQQNENEHHELLDGLFEVWS